MVRVDLNADVGEGVGSPGDDDRLLALVTSASIACGVHAGDERTMRAALEASARRGVVVGAHPSYDDRDGFGRRAVDVEPARLVAGLEAQIGALDSLAHECGTRVRYVKPHGALYHRMASDHMTAEAVLDAMDEFDDLVLLAPAGSLAVTVAVDRNVVVAAEAFADRAYAPDGSLVSRSEPGAVITDPGDAAHRALSLALDGQIPATDGTLLALHPASICVHGDTPGALEIATRVRVALAAGGVAVASFVS
ncbi:MAG TPA: 5-oxoprolinase subunit PxpA [Acidimicrobiales bacterium]|nr:5-oxoprolinase subunit PxpA [Acidimicrobiales bacterium]